MSANYTHLVNATTVLGAYNVRDFGADPTGTFDATADIQSALNAAGAAGAAPCIVPAGQYLIAGQLNVPAGVACLGPAGCALALAPQSGGPQGATLLITGGAGNASGTPAITLNTSSTIRGFAVYHPNQSATATTPTAYPFALLMAGVNSRAEDLNLVNPYQGIHATQGRVIIRDIQMQALSMGVLCESSQDINRFENIMVEPNWSWTGSFAGPSAWALANGTAYQFGRSDEQYCRGLFAFGYNTGFAFVNQTSGAATGTTYGTFEGCSIDTCNVGIRATAVGGTSGAGINWIGGGIEPNNTAISLTSGPLLFVGARFYSGLTPVITHTGGDLVFDACRFQSAFPITSSGTTFVFNGNVLKSTGSTIALSGTGKATIVGNTAPAGTTFASLVSGTMSGGTVTGNNN